MGGPAGDLYQDRGAAMTHEEKRALWRLYPEVWEMFVEFNGITLEDSEAWSRLVDRSDQIWEAGGCTPVLQELILATVDDLEGIAKEREGG